MSEFSGWVKQAPIHLITLVGCDCYENSCEVLRGRGVLGLLSLLHVGQSDRRPAHRGFPTLGLS